MKEQKQQNGRRSGYVLILVLAMLIIATLLSAGVARRSLDQTVAAAKRAEELQRRWGEISLRHTALSRAEILLRTAELREGVRQSSIQTTVRLGDQTFYLILSDEQAKLNVNTAFRYGDEQAVRRVLFESAIPWTIKLRPDPRAAQNSPFPPAFASWGQLYDFSALSAIPERHHLMLTQLGERITCWGDGQLNINRADDEMIRMACEWVASPQSASALIELRREHPDWNFERLMREVDISDQDRRAIRRVLTDRSRTHSLWTITRNENRSWVRLDIRSADAPFGNNIETFYY
jgi:type II secretory pathway component PulK